MEKRTRGVRIDENGGISLVNVDSLAEIQKAVGGYFEQIRLGDTGLYLLMDEDGKAKNKMVNQAATGLAAYLGSGLNPGDLIVGPVVIAGNADLAGNYEDLPESLIMNLRRAVWVELPRLLGEAIVDSIAERNADARRVRETDAANHAGQPELSGQTDPGEQGVRGS